VPQGEKNMKNSKISTEAKRILLDGELLEKTEAVALKLSHNYDFARRMIQEISLILAGQAIKHLDVGIKTRAFSHAGLYGAHGFGRDFTWDIATKSGIFPINNPIRITRLDNITEAALIGTISESQIVPPITVTHDMVFVGEYSTLMRGQNADSLAASMRSLLETSEYRRRLAKVAGLNFILEGDDKKRKRSLIKALEEASKKGLFIDTSIGEIAVETTTSWIISSARFGSDYTYGKPLLALGDVDRYRWRSHLPTKEERLKITAEVGSLPPIVASDVDIRTINEAWKFLLNTLYRKIGQNAIKVDSNEWSFQKRKKLWVDTQNLIFETYPELAEQHVDQLINLRTRAEFRRLLIQHATTKQFQRDQGYDLAEPGKFIIDYKEDGEFAQNLWLEEFVPSMIDVIDDIQKYDPKRRSKRRKTLTQKGEEIVKKRLEKGIAGAAELAELVKKKGISVSLLNNKILKKMLREDIICKPTGYKYYKLKKNCPNCGYFSSCTERETD
jgi:hypothetical protein